MIRERKAVEVGGELSDSSTVSVQWLGVKLAGLRYPAGVVLLLRNLRTMNPAPKWDRSAIAETDEAEFKRAWQEFDLPEVRGFRIFFRPEVLDEIAGWTIS